MPTRKHNERAYIAATHILSVHCVRAHVSGGSWYALRMLTKNSFMHTPLELHK